MRDEEDQANLIPYSLYLIPKMESLTYLIQQLPQLITFGIISGSIITLGAIGLSLTYSILRFANFAHGDMLSLGAYFAFAVLALLKILGLPDRPLGPLSFGLPMILAFVAALALTAVVSILLDHFLYRRFRFRGARPVILLISSVGVALTLRNLIQIVWGPWPLYYRQGFQVGRVVPFIGVRIKPDQIFIIAVAAVLVVALHLFLQRTKMGKAMRATADNPELARVAGIDTDRVIRWTWGIGAALAAAAGVLLGIDVQLQPVMGWDMLLPLFAAVILGSIGSPYGAMVGGLIIGLSGEISTAIINPAYKPAVAFIIMVLMLLIKPSGLFGGKR